MYFKKSESSWRHVAPFKHGLLSQGSICSAIKRRETEEAQEDYRWAKRVTSLGRRGRGGEGGGGVRVNPTTLPPSVPLIRGWGRKGYGGKVRHQCVSSYSSIFHVLSTSLSKHSTAPYLHRSSLCSRPDSYTCSPPGRPHTWRHFGREIPRDTPSPRLKYTTLWMRRPFVLPNSVLSNIWSLNRGIRERFSEHFPQLINYLFCTANRSALKSGASCMRMLIAHHDVNGFEPNIPNKCEQTYSKTPFPGGPIYHFNIAVRRKMYLINIW